MGKSYPIDRFFTETDYQQQIKTSNDAVTLTMRHATVELDQHARDGDAMIHLLTNLPATVSALEIADLHRQHWEEGTGDYFLTITLICEVGGIGTPRAD